MTGFNNNNNNIKLVPTTPKTYTVLELKDQEVKKSPLSLAARNKVINKSGSNYFSEKEGYGPVVLGEDLNGKARRENRKAREEEFEIKTKQGICVYGGCKSLVADTAASMFIPGYAATKAVAGVVSSIAGQASGSQSASDFGNNAVKNEITGEA